MVPEKKSNGRNLTEKQRTFLGALFSPETQGKVREAMNLAGYSKNLSTKEVLEPLKDEIIEATNLFLAANGPAAAMALVDVLFDPNQLGAGNKKSVASEILDRAGVVKKQEVGGNDKPTINNVIILPEKNEPKDLEKIINGEFSRGE